VDPPAWTYVSLAGDLRLAALRVFNEEIVLTGFLVAVGRLGVSECAGCGGEADG